MLEFDSAVSPLPVERIFTSEVSCCKFYLDKASQCKSYPLHPTDTIHAFKKEAKLSEVVILRYKEKKWLLSQNLQREAKLLRGRKRFTCQVQS